MHSTVVLVKTAIDKNGMNIFLKKIYKLMGYLFNKMANKNAERVIKYYSILGNKPTRRWSDELKNTKVKKLSDNTKRKRRQKNEKKFLGYGVDRINTDIRRHTFICR